MKKANYKALLPIGVFLVLYLGLGIPMGFYNIPIVVIFLAALLVACVQNPKLTFEEKLEIMTKGVGDKNIITSDVGAAVVGEYNLNCYGGNPGIGYLRFD